MATTPKHRYSALTASAAVKATATNLHAVTLRAGTTASTVKFTNDADGSGATVFSLSAPANGPSVHVSFEDLGPVYFTSKCYATIAGTAAEVYVWFD